MLIFEMLSAFSLRSPASRLFFPPRHYSSPPHSRWQAGEGAQQGSGASGRKRGEQRAAQ